MTAVFAWRGQCVSVRGEPDHLSSLARHMPPFFARTFEPQGEMIAAIVLSEVGGMIGVELPDALSYAGPVTEQTCRAIASRIELLMASRLTDLAAVHAGVVTYMGRAIVLPGTSMAGKSTLVQALVDLGATYYSDEFALLDRQGQVWPYPRALTTRTPDGSSRSLPERRAPADNESSLVALLAELHYLDGQSWRVQPASVSTMWLGLIRNAINVRRCPDLAGTALTAATRSAVGITGTRGQATEAATQLLELLAQH